MATAQPSPMLRRTPQPPALPRRRPRPRPLRPPRLLRTPAPATAVPAAAVRPAAATDRAILKRYLLAGLLVWLPLAITIWVLHAILGTLDGVFAWLLSASQAVLPSAAYTPLDMLKRVP